MSSLPIDIREYTDSDENFIFSSWLKSQCGQGIAKSIPKSIYFPEHHKVVERILSNNNTQIKIACDPADPSVVYGYLVYEIKADVFVFHYAYTKHSFRKFGIFKLLLSQSNYRRDMLSTTSTITNAGGSIADKLNVVYNPYLLMK